MPESTILENKEVLYELIEQKASFKLIKVFTSNDSEDEMSPYAYDSKEDKTIRMDDKSHTQLFYNTTDKTSLSTCTPSYSRDVYRPNNKIDNLYWYNEALKSSSALWTIDQVKIKKSKMFGRVKRPRVFTINNSELDSQSVFEYGSSEYEPKGYSGEVTTPFDQSSIQRYRWVRCKDGSRWVFIARNDPNTPLVEFRKTASKNEFDIVFLEYSPPGWKFGSIATKNTNSIDSVQSAQFMGRYPSMFSNPSTYRSSTTSGFLSNRESSFSDVSNIGNNEGGHDKNSKSFSTYSESRYSESRYSENKFTSLKNLTKFDDSTERYWQEYVLASTVAIQDEVNSNKKRLWRKSEI